MKRKLLATVGVVALTIPLAAAAAAASPIDPDETFTPSQGGGEIDSDFRAAALQSGEPVKVIVELEGDPVAVVEAEQGRALSDDEKAAVATDLEVAQAPVTDDIAALGGEVHYQMQSAYNGVTATVPATELDAIAALPGVVGVHAAPVFEQENSVSVPYLGVPQVWQSTGYTGQNVKVAIIDSGIDYTHATFGGPGTVEAFEAAAATSDQPADPAWFGPDSPRVKGGIDLVGDDYQAGDAVYGTPQPDPNPLDCGGHGTHVAGTTGGGGVTADGQPYTGPYDASTAEQDFLVGPGVAPEVDLYAVRVFGCDGSSDVVVEAIDWAVANDIDVINMSLGSVFGRADDPSAVAATNAIGAGVVVVASAGNSGPSPYLTGSPGAGDGVIAVSAMDGTQYFPGAILSVDGQDVEAVNANDASLDELGTVTVVRLTDDPATPANESLGCAVSDFTRVGIAEGSGQLAVVQRGTCARVAKAIFGEQAGAAAVLQINNADVLPPYEFPITENPDDGTPYVVTIPFFGVRSSADSVFVDGAQVTATAAQVDNDLFATYGSFTSSGPRSGDSAISPLVSAPGVSIASAGVGTGNGAAVLSGTSMAAPHVAGVAALTVQAHPGWAPADVAAAIVSTSNPEALRDQSLVRGGVGVVDTAQAVSTTVIATGDAFETADGWARESALSFGFQESAFAFAGVKTVTVTNHGTASVTYNVTTEPSAQSLKASVVTTSKRITVRPGQSVKFVVSVFGSARDVPSSLIAGDQFAFNEISGDVVLTSGDSTLRVPYLLVPRTNSLVSTSLIGSLTGKEATITSSTKSLRLYNLLGAVDANADVFTWGLSDPADLPDAVADSGVDLRSVGVQSYDTSDGKLLVFAVNTHHRFSNAAANEYSVVIDVDRDGTPDWAVFSFDSGAVRSGFSDGVPEVFLQNIRTGQLYASGFLAQAPTDSSTVLLPVYADSLGIDGAFAYTAETASRTTGASDTIAGYATYDANAPAITNGQSALVKRNGNTTVPLSVDKTQVTAQKPLGVMVVVLDNRSGKDEALLVSLK